MSSTTQNLIPDLHTTVSDILKMSITSLLILQVLFRSETPLKRTELLENLNAYLGGADYVVTQTFYNQIDKLEEKGYIAATRGTTGKIDTIQTTGKTKFVLDQISEITFFGSINIYEYVEELFNIVLEQVGVESVESLLLVNLEEGLDVRAVDIMSNIANVTFIASSDDAFQRYRARNLSQKIQQSKIIGDKIREPADIFEVTSIIGYECGRDYFNYSERNWLQEAVRVTQPGGMIVVSAVERIPKSNHFLIDHIINRVDNIQFITQLSRHELTSELIAVGLRNIQIISHRGILVGIGMK